MFIVHIEHIKHTGCIEHREVTQMALTGEARKARAAYLRQWRKRNPGKQKEYDQKKWEKKAAAIRAEKEAAAAAEASA